ncbi:MAG TPA: response regulator transcription factor [Burkholderiales bacterium]|nr:response regulator transcription factor [Burkholderiales bacterium]
MKILVVDDHPLIREALRTVLRDLDPSIALVEAENGAATLAAAREHADLDLVLLDLSLPDGNGLVILETLRETYPALPVVVLSATEDPDTVTRALDGGAMGFIPKTSSNRLLLNALRLVLAGGVYLPAQVLGQAHAAAGAVPTARPGSPAKTPADIGLTRRQAQVLGLMVQGKPNKLICRELDLAEGTVKIHITAILRALGVSNRTQAVIAVGRMGLRLEDAAPGRAPS